MRPTGLQAQKKNLLLAFDAFGTLYTPSVPVPTIYSKAAFQHGIDCSNGQPNNTAPVKKSFGRAFREESKLNPNYGKASGLGAEKWWSNVITKTMQPFLKHGQDVPQTLINELLTRFSTSEGYHMYPDVLPFFQMLRDKRKQKAMNPPWQWDRTVVGIITNSDDRVPSILKSFGLNVVPRRFSKHNDRSELPTLEEDVSFVVLSYDVGFQKPDPRIFEAATQILKEMLDGNREDLTTDDFEKLIVGDSLKHDYMGAEASGWDAVYLDRNTNLESPEQLEKGLVTFKAINGKEEKRCVCVASNLTALKWWEPDRAH